MFLLLYLGNTKFTSVNIFSYKHTMNITFVAVLIFANII